MKTLHKAVLALVTGSVLSMSAQAVATYTPAADAAMGNAYAGVKVGQFMLDDEGLDKLDKPTAYGIVAGYQATPNWGAEAEYVGSSKGDLVDGLDTAEFDVKSYGAYGTYRYMFPNTDLYAKAKLGLAKVKTDVEYSDGDKFSDSDTGIAGGVGLGYSLKNNLGVEAEYSMIDSDAKAKLWTVGDTVKF